MVTTVHYSRGNLPHWLVADHSFFVTLRLAGSIPRAILLKIDEAMRLEKDADEAVRHRLRFHLFEEHLHMDRTGPHWMKDSHIAGLILENLDWLEQKRGWLIHAATIMSNHIHLLMRNTIGRSGGLLSDLGRFKSYTGTLANRALQRTGDFWARECFDHWCRDESKVRGVARYICNNPVKARQVEHWTQWPWTRCVDWLKPE